MANTIQKQIAEACRDQYLKGAPERIKRFLRLAWWDLNYGPVTFCEDCGADRLSDCTCENPYPGWETALDEIKAWSDDLPSEAFFDSQCGQIQDSEPEPWTDEETGEVVEPFWEDFYKVNPRKEILGVLSEYV